MLEYLRNSTFTTVMAWGSIIIYVVASQTFEIIIKDKLASNKFEKPHAKH